MAQNCISLTESSACPAFNNSSASTDSSVISSFPFLAFVSNVEDFDNGLQQYIATDFSKQRYQELIGCTNIDLTDTTNLYARYTTSVLCNSIVQISQDFCGTEATPLCADTCAEYAISEHDIVSSPETCGEPGSNALDQIRADFTNCGLPANSLMGTCISGVENEPIDCGYQSNLAYLCSFCADSSPNSTDSCCVFADVETRCEGVELPITTEMAPLFPSSTSTADQGAEDSTSSGLSGGQIAGVVVGSVLGALILLGTVILFCKMRKSSTASRNVFNQPFHPLSRASSMTFIDGARPSEVVPPGRVARMSALENPSSSSGHSIGNRNAARNSSLLFHQSSDDYNPSPKSQRSGMAIGPLPLRGRSAFAIDEGPSSPASAPRAELLSTPDGLGGGQSEQLNFFKDYYSQDEILVNEAVSVLWAYQPRANDEFELDRGDMLKVVGIWDDGWATGMKISQRAEDWGTKLDTQRDSGISNESRQPTPRGTDVVDGVIKAFPLVCVCVPRHWRKTIEGDSTDTDSPARDGLLEGVPNPSISKT